MKVASLKGLLDACFLAKRIVDTLPELPQHMKPRHIHVLNVVRETQQQRGVCRVSDVSDSLSITMPSVTRIGYFNGYGKSIPVMIQGITSAFLIRIPVSIFMSRLPGASLLLVGLATPITTIYGILFFVVCFAWLRHKES